jgi:hypothetical protein
MDKQRLQDLVIEAARMAPSADNSQPWQLRLQDQTISVHHRPTGGTDPFGPHGHATLISVGAVAENLSQILSESGQSINICDLEGGAPYFSISMPQHAAASSPQDFALFARGTNRFPYAKTPPDTNLLQHISQLHEPLVRTQLLLASDKRNTFSDIVETCCKARFCNRELHEWLMSSLRFTTTEIDQGDGLALNTINLPPGGGLFMQWIRPWQRMNLLNKIGAFKLMAINEAQLLRNAPLIIAIQGEDTPNGTFAAGRLMERVWILLNQSGWAVHPYYVITDQETRLQSRQIPVDWEKPVAQAINETRALLSLKPGERLHMAMRVGKPTKTPPRSLRLPVSQIFPITAGSRQS